MICFSYICIITKLNAKFPIILPPRQTKTATNLRQREANELKTKRKGSRRLPVQFVGVEISELQTNLSFIRKIIYAIITHPSRFYCPRPQHFLQRRGLQAGAVLLEGRVLLLEGLAELVDGALPEFILQTDFLGALAHGDEVLIMRRVGRQRDGDDINLNRDVHNDYVLLMTLEVNCLSSDCDCLARQ